LTIAMIGLAPVYIGAYNAYRHDRTVAAK
jgi:hypothetical protein